MTTSNLRVNSSLLLLAGAAIGLGLFVLFKSRPAHSPTRYSGRAGGKRLKAAAIHPKDPAAAAAKEGQGVVRAAGPENMRDGDETRWDKVDQASDESFPASD